MRRYLLAIVLSGCGAVDHGASPDSGPGTDAAAQPDAPVDAPAVVTDRNCTEVKARLGTATDGVYMIDPDREGVAYKPFAVFCAGMASATPREYLELARKSDPAANATANFSTYAMGSPHASWTCDCGVATTVYSKVRIDPATLVLSGFDETFAVYAKSTDVACLGTKSGCPGPAPWGLAMACAGNFNAAGRANIDLRDLPFHVAGMDNSAFSADGFTPVGSVDLDTDRKVAALTGGGDCGEFGALHGVPLAQDF
jgi:GON domain-containing protein